MLPHSSRGMSSALPSGWPVVVSHLDFQRDVSIIGHTSRVGEGCSDVMDRIAVGPFACFLVDEEGIEEVLE